MSKACILENPQVAEVATRELTLISCPLGFVHGYRCSTCNWATLFPECHVRWAVPFCYELQVKKTFAQHLCAATAKEAPQVAGCKLCESEGHGYQ